MADHAIPHASDAEEEKFRAEFEEQLDAVVADTVSDNPVRPFLFRSTIALAVADNSGEILWRDRKFENWLDPQNVDPETCRSVLADQESSHVLIRDESARPILLTYAPANLAKQWASFDADIDHYLDAPSTAVIAAISLSHMSDEIEYSARALGLSNLEARVGAALFVHGSIKQAAVHAGVTYHTARKALAGAMKSLGIPRQTSFVRKLSELTTMAEPPGTAVEKILADVFGIAKRDAKLVHLLCEGYSRADAAKVAGISDAVAKDRFSDIFQKLEIESATDLPQLVMVAFASAVLVGTSKPLVQTSIRDRAPLRLIKGFDGRVIAVNDYGPPDGRPVLIAHSSLSTRHPFRKLVGALQVAGYRPITIDRPGFGLTDIAKEQEDRFATGVDDVATVCKALGFAEIDLISRGGAFHVLAIARALPEKVGRVVVINPDLLQHDCSTRKGHLGLVRLAFDRYPSSIEKVVSWISAQLSRKRVETIIRAGIGDAPADLESFSDARNMEDYRRSIMAFATGRLSGFIREQRGYALQTEVKGLSDASNWTVLLGASDPIHDIEEIKSFWSEKLPGASQRVIPDAGRYISLSHTDLVVSALSE